jgi:ribosomal protein L11 methylase PrmA
MTATAKPDPEAAPAVRSTAPAPAGEHPGATRDPGSYRDPAGFVFRRSGTLYRQIQATFADDWELFIGSGLYERLRGEGLLLGHEEVGVESAAAPPAYRVIRPEALDFVSYPYEWSFSQLKDAALLTLRAQTLAAEAGMTLRDASAYNVQFQRGTPVLIDSLSFERAEEGRPWVAYRQFCEHFLAPLALMSRVDIRLGSLLRDHLEGVPLDLAAHLLPGRTRFSLSLGPHIHLHARAQRRHADDGRASGAADGGNGSRPATMSASRLATLVESLRTTVEGLDWAPEGTVWADYAENTSYDDAATAAKEAAVASALAAAGGSIAWDLGANTGRYSWLAADRGYRVVALDVDPGAVERHYRHLRADGRTDTLPLLADLTNPSPAQGWGSAERASLLARADADVVLALALVHHLAIGANVPLPMIAALFARLAPQAIVEFVPKEDAMVQRLLASRRDVFPGYTIEGFREAFAIDFDLLSETHIEGTARTLFHVRRHA